MTSVFNIPLFFLIFWLTTGTDFIYAQVIVDNYHVCSDKEQIKETVTRPCTYFNTQNKTENASPYTINWAQSCAECTQKERVNLVNNNTAECVFQRTTEEPVTKCCPQWTGTVEAGCPIPVCKPPCKTNQGVCIQPNVCTCYEGYSGDSCSERPDEVTAYKQYCYARKNCKGDPVTDEPIKRTDCCEAGMSWGYSAKGELPGKCSDCEHPAPGTVVDTSDAPMRTCFRCGHNLHRSFDGMYFSFAGRCIYTLAKVVDLFEIQVEMTDCEDNSPCKKILHLILFDGNLKVDHEGGKVYVNGEVVTGLIPGEAVMEGSSVAITIDPDGTTVLLEIVGYGVKIKAEADDKIYISVPKEMEGMTGLCGNNDDNPYNDFQGIKGEILANAAVFGNLQAVETPDKICTPAGMVPDYCTTDELRAEAQKACSVLDSPAFSACYADKKSDIIASCINEHCAATGDKQKVICDHLEIYAEECACQGTVVNYRTNDLCLMCPEDANGMANGVDPDQTAPGLAKDCPATYDYRANMPAVHKTCYHVWHDVHTDYQQTRASGCFCPDIAPYIQHGKCVAAEECQCTHGDTKFVHGGTTKISCRQCVCHYGWWNCEDIDCPAICTIHGSSHVGSFDGKKFTFKPGDQRCMYTLLMPREETKYEIDGLTVSIETTKKPNSELREITGTHVKLNNPEKNIMIDIVVKIKEGSDTVVTVNNERAQLPFSNSFARVHQATSLFYVVKLMGLVVMCGRGRTYLRIEPIHHDKVYGVCGRYNSDEKDDFFVHSQAEESQITSFVDNFKDAECPDTTEDDIPCGQSVKETARLSCQHFKDQEFPQDCTVKANLYYEQCVHDMCADNSHSLKPMCDVTAHFAWMCNKQNTPLKWYEYKNLGSQCSKTMQCSSASAGTQYKESTKCEAHCHDLATENDFCDPEIGLPGCVCPENQVLNEEMNMCVDKSECMCKDKFDQEKFYKPGQNRTTKCKICICKDGQLNCTDKHPLEECKEEVSCPHNQIYVQKEPTCKKTCKNMKQDCDSTKLYTGCTCPEDHFMKKSGECVREEDCPCYYSNIEYAPGSEKKVERCSSYLCQGNATWGKYKAENCPGMAKSVGESHYVTFDGEHYDFYGTCEYTFVADKNGKFMISLQNHKCAHSNISCTKSIKIRMPAEHPVYEIHLLGGMPFKINGKISDSKAYSNEIFEIEEGIGSMWTVFNCPELGIKLKFDGALRTEVSLDQAWMGSVEGLADDFDGIARPEDWKATSGITTPDVFEFALGWSVNPDKCYDTYDFDYYKKCGKQKFPHRAHWAETSCEIIRKKDGVFGQCVETMGSKVNDYYDHCVKDACRCAYGGDCKCLCDAIAAFADECAKIDFPVRWRNINHCPIQCDYELRYIPYASACEKTCFGISSEVQNCTSELEGMEGCFCPEEMYRDGNDCLEIEDCPCYYKKGDVETSVPPRTNITDDCIILRN